MNSHSFQDDIRPLIEEYRRRSRCDKPYNQRPEPPRTPSDPRSEEPSLSDISTPPEDIPLPTSNESSNLSIPHTVPIHDRTTSNLSSFDEDDDELALVPCTFTSIFTFYSFTDKITFLHKTPLLLDLLCSCFHILRSRVTLAVTVSPIRS